MNAATSILQFAFFAKIITCNKTLIHARIITESTLSSGYSTELSNKPTMIDNPQPEGVRDTDSYQDMTNTRIPTQTLFLETGTFKLYLN